MDSDNTGDHTGRTAVQKASDIFQGEESDEPDSESRNHKVMSMMPQITYHIIIEARIA